jgi:hypothetical protein
MKYFSLSLCFIITSNCFAQAKNDSAISDVDFLINKIRHTYIGYNMKENKADYDKLINDVKVSTTKDTLANLSRLTLYFNDCHFTLYEIVRKKLKNIDSNACVQNLRMIDSSAPTKFKKMGNEGYWINDNNTVLMYLKQKSKELPQGYVIESTKNIAKGFCNIKLNNDLRKGLIADYIDIDYGFRLFTKSYFKNKKVLLIGSHSMWRKVNNYYKGMLQKQIAIDYPPSIRVLDSNTIVFDMKDFSTVGRKVYDSVVKANIKVVEKQKHLY